MIPPSLDLDSMAVASDGATGDGDPIDPPARHSDSRVAAGNRVAALEHYAGEIDPGTRCSGDDDPAFIAVGDPVSARADAHVSLHLRAGPGRTNAWCRDMRPGEQREHQGEGFEDHGRTG